METKQNLAASTPKVTVIMTTYNAEKYIEESLQTVLAQDIRELEVLCVDGHSKDRTLQIIRSYSESDGRVRLVFQDRPGIGAAKNCGIENAKGEYITFLDADDFYVDTTALRIMYETCRKENVSVCGALRSTLFLDGRLSREPLHRGYCAPGKGPVRIQYRDWQYDYHFHGYLYDRKMIQDSDARFAEVRAYDDTHFFIRAMLLAKEFCAVPVELYRYRCGPAYDWGMEQTNDAMLALTDQLCLTRKERLADLHWVTVQRINYEYARVIEKNILAGDITLLKQLIAANELIDPELLQQVEKNPPSDKWYLEPMLHRHFADCPMHKGGDCAPAYILEPLWAILHPDSLPAENEFRKEAKKEISQLQKKLAGQKMQTAELKRKLKKAQEDLKTPWIVRKVRGGVRCLRENGFVYTVRRLLGKIAHRLSK